MVRAEPLLVIEAAKNLVSNALLYAGRGAVVTVKTWQDGHGPVLEVEDNGPGIPAERRQAALTRFERAGIQGGSGSGLGLPIVEEIALLHGGLVELGDGPHGAGLTVRVRFQADM